MVNYTKHQHISTSSATSSTSGLIDGTDKIHTGIVKALELAAAGTAVLEYGSSVFQQTAGSTRTQFGVSGAIKYMREGLVLSSTPTAVELTADPDVTNDRYDMIVIQSSDNNFAVRVGTAATVPRVADNLTAGDIPVALVKVVAGASSTKNATTREVQLFGFDKTSNSLSVGYSDSGVYTEMSKITAASSGTTIEVPTAGGDFIIDNTDADKKIVARLGSDDTNTAFEVRNNSDAAKLSVTGAGVTTVTGSLSTTTTATIGTDLTVSGGDINYSNAQNATLKVAATTSTTAGRDLTIEAGSTSTGSNNIDGGDLILKSGGGDGTGTSTMSFHTKVDGTDTAAERMKINTTGNLELTGTDITLGGDTDGSDKKITFGHSTLKSVIGIDDDSDVFAINTDNAFEAVNDLEIDASGNVTLGNGGLTLTGGDISVTGAVTASTTVTGNKLAGNALGYVSAVVNANDSSPTIDGDYSNIFVHALGGSNNEVVLASVAASNAMEAGRVITIKNTDTSDTIIIGTTAPETIEEGRVEHPMVVTANKINLAPFESVTIRAETDSKESLSNSGFLIVDSIGMGRGKHSIWVPAASMYPNTTNGCAALAQVELGNGPELKSLDFDKDSDEFAQFTVAFPKSWNGGTVSFQAFFTADSTNTGTTAWGLAGVSFADNDSINTAFGTPVVATAKAHSGTANDIDVTNESGNITIAGSPSANELVYFEIHRDVSADSLTADAKLLGIKLFYTTDKGNDA